MNYKKSQSCSVSFTGHRPQKMPGGFNWSSCANKEFFVDKLFPTLEKLICSYDDIKFISGGAIGFDQMAFAAVQFLKEQTVYKKYKIKNTLAIPFEKQYILWNKQDKERHFIHLKQADEVVFVDTIQYYNPPLYNIGEYSFSKMQARNEYMVDNSDIVIAAWNGTTGGTKNCVDYAKQQNKEIIFLPI